jgi:hypothetical protein
MKYLNMNDEIRLFAFVHGGVVDLVGKNTGGV